MAYSSLVAAVKRKNSLATPLSASTPTAGVQELDPLKTPAPSAPGGFNAQSAANAAGASPTTGALGIINAAKAGAGGQPAPGGYMPPPLPPPTQPLADTSAVRRSAPALSASQREIQAPAIPGTTLTQEQFYGGPKPVSAGGGLDPNGRNFPGPGGKMLTRAEWEQYQRVLGAHGIPQAVERTGPVTDPTTGQTATPTVAGGNLPPEKKDELQTGQKPYSVYDDPAIKPLLDELQARMSGKQTASSARMNDRAQQQANASRQDVDRRLSGRGMGATNPLRDKLYGDIQQSVNDQMMLRDAQQQESATQQYNSLLQTIQAAKNSELAKQQIAQQGRQFDASLASNEQQQNTSNWMSLASSFLPPIAKTGYDAFTKYLDSRNQPTLGGDAPGFATKLTAQDPRKKIGNWGGF